MKVNNIIIALLLLIFCELKVNSQSYFEKGVVVSKNKIASQIGAQILSAGGNAFDAAVATGYAIGVVEPNGSGIGGGGFALVYISETKELKAIDFRERAPQDINKYPYMFITGPKAGGIPGTIAGFEYLRTKYGFLDRKKLIEPSIKLAQEGFKIDNNLYKAIKARHKVLKRFKSSSKIFLLKGKVPQVGQIIRNKELANTLKIVSNKGANEFYKGELAKIFSSELQKNGGIIKFSDLKSYKVYEVSPICGTYRKKYNVCSFPPPSSGGVCLIEALNIIENFDISSLEFKSPQRIHYLIQSLKYSFADRALKLGDPRFSKIPVQELVSKSYAKKIAKKIKSSKNLNINLIRVYILISILIKQNKIFNC